MSTAANGIRRSLGAKGIGFSIRHVSCRALKAFVAGRKDERISAGLRVAFAGGEGVARNVSATGIYFVTASAFAEGQSVKLHIEFPDFPGGRLEVTCYGRVVRVTNQGAARGVGVAIASFEFRRVSAPGRKLIREVEL
jgi:PilZ domain-containing protein